MSQRIFGLLLAAALSAAAAAASAPTENAPPAPAAQVGLFSGSVQVQLGGSDVWFMAKPDQRLPTGSLVKTESGSSCAIFFWDQSKVRLGPKATFRLGEVSADKVTVYIGSGKLEAWVKNSDKREFQARNPVSTASVQTAVFVMDVLSPASVTLDLFEGALTIQDQLGNTAQVAEGQRVEASATTGVSAPAPMPTGISKPAEPTITAPDKPARKKPAQQAEPQAPAKSTGTATSSQP